MAKRRATPVPKSLASALAEFTSWRQQRRRVEPIPESLWACAVKAAREHGITRTMHVLNLEFYALKRRMEERAPVVKSEPSRSEPAFVELPAIPTGGRSSCTIELRAEEGRSLRLELDGMNADDIAAVVRGLWTQG